MDSFNFHKLKAEKANAILKHRQLRKIANLLRYFEVCVVLVLISRLSIQLPVAVKNYSEYFRDFSVFMGSPRFVFLVGNVIIITLFAQSGQFSAHGSANARANPELDIYQEFIQNSTMNQTIDGDQTEYPKKKSIRTGDSTKGQRINGYLIKYLENESMKQITKTEDKIKDQTSYRLKKQSTKTGDTNISLEVKDYRRCQSEIISHVDNEKPRCALHRCETENSRRSIELAAPERVGRTSYPEDGMSNEEFHRTIEAFIARQQRLRRQEQSFTE